jgi:cellobiose phosphorylase
MPETHPDQTPIRLSGSSGLRAQINGNGSLRRFDCDAISLTLFVGNEIEGGPTNLYLRHLAQTTTWTPLLGPLSATRFQFEPSSGALTGEGSWQGIDYRLALLLAKDRPAWFWHVYLENTGSSAKLIDLTYAQDLALAPYGAIRNNEFYVSQYLDHTPLSHGQHGIVVASRQNQAADGRNPWSVIGSLRNGASFATDSLQFHGLASRAGGAPAGVLTDLPNRRLQHEHSMVVIRDTAIQLEPGKPVAAGFFGGYEAHHPAATFPADLDRIGPILSLPEATPAAHEAPSKRMQGGAAPGNVSTPTSASTVPATATPASASAGTNRPAGASMPGGASTLFSCAPVLNGRDLDTATMQQLFSSQWRHEELDEHGAHLSFFHGTDQHVVLRAKELRVTRPHGHMLRTGRHTTPDELGLTSTVWMSGVFHSMVTQGHVNINRMLSTVHSYLGLFRSHGQRVFVEIAGSWRLLNVPSAFEMSPDSGRWIYQHDEGVLQVRAEAQSKSPPGNPCVS